MGREEGHCITTRWHNSRLRYAFMTCDYGWSVVGIECWAKVGTVGPRGEGSSGARWLAERREAKEAVALGGRRRYEEGVTSPLWLRSVGRMAWWEAKTKEVVAFGGCRIYERRRRQWFLVAGGATRTEALFRYGQGVPAQPKSAR